MTTGPSPPSRAHCVAEQGLLQLAAGGGEQGERAVRTRAAARAAMREPAQARIGQVRSPGPPGRPGPPRRAGPARPPQTSTCRAVPVLTIWTRRVPSSSASSAAGSRSWGRAAPGAPGARITRARTAYQAQRELFLESTMLLLPLIVIVVLLFALRLSRPLRQIDRAIGELAAAISPTASSGTGLVDLELLGHQLEWLRNRLLELAQERNRFLLGGDRAGASVLYILSYDSANPTGAGVAAGALRHHRGGAGRRQVCAGERGRRARHAPRGGGAAAAAWAEQFR